MDYVESGTALAAQIFGFLWSFTSSLAQSIATGDRDELVRVALSLAILYVSIVILHRTARLLLRTILFFVYLSLIFLIISSGIYVYQVGPEEAIPMARNWLSSHGPWLARYASLGAVKAANTAYNQYAVYRDRLTDELRSVLSK